MTPRMGATDWGLVLLLSLLWGGAFFCTELALAGLPPLTVVLGRVGFAALTLWAVGVLTGQRLPLAPRLWGAFLVMGLLNNLLPFSLIISAQVQIESGLAAILNATTPLFSVLLAAFLTADERLTAARLAGVLLGLAGVVVLIGPEALRGLGASGWAQLAVLGAACSYACAAIFGRRFRSLPALAVATGQVTCSSLLALPLALLLERPWSLQPEATAWLGLLGLALPGTALAYLIYFRVLATAGATNLMLVTFLIPISAVLLGALFLGERLPWPTFAGTGLIFLGLAAIDGRLLGSLQAAVRQRRAAGRPQMPG
ncbi:MAG: DMT family transporter [Kiloniellales bacterium]